MSDLHRAYLSLGSNIDPETNLPAAIRMLGKSGTVEAVSSVWESRAVGAQGPNFLNACTLYLTPQSENELKETTLKSIEARLGRTHSRDPNAPRTIDIDMLTFDDRPLDLDRWAYAFVLVPLAELAPDLPDPATGEPLRDAAERARSQTWFALRPDVSLVTEQ